MHIVFFNYLTYAHSIFQLFDFAILGLRGTRVAHPAFYCCPRQRPAPLPHVGEGLVTLPYPPLRPTIQPPCVACPRGLPPGPAPLFLARVGDSEPLWAGTAHHPATRATCQHSPRSRVTWPRSTLGLHWEERRAIVGQLPLAQSYAFQQSSNASSCTLILSASNKPANRNA